MSRNFVFAKKTTWMGHMHAYNFFDVDQRSFVAQWGSVVVDASQTFVMSIRSGDIHGQIRKLSNIAQKFGRFFPSQILLGQPFQTLCPHYHACLAARRLLEFREDIPANTKVI